MQYALVVLLLVLVGCASSPQRLEDVAGAEAARLASPQRPLAGFAEYELAPLELAADVAADERKRAVASDLESRLREALEPQFANWRLDAQANPEGRSGTLVVRAQVVALRIVSGGTRFWAGGFAGDSTIDLDLELLAKGESAPFTRVRVSRSAGAAAGGWSVGATDRNLLNYAAAIVCRYLADGYGTSEPNAVPGVPIES